jgi:uncharacterized protein (TIGR00661 family)
MKILYAIQATGNGHISRGIELLPYLKQYGDVDVFLSGSNSSLHTELPVQYRSKGASLFYGNKGGLDYLKMLKEFSPVRIWKEANDLPVEKYDVVINDFESITSLACKIKNVPSINFGHQASFKSKNTPRPAKKEFAGEFLLKNYALATAYIGLHFKSYDDFIYSPVIKEDILRAEIKNEGHITVYLSHYSDEILSKHFKQLPDLKFEVFSKKVKTRTREGNISFIPVDNKAFNESMISAAGIITGAGFETPAEALYMGKKLMCLPIKAQYEQLCNAEALKDFNVPIIHSIDQTFTKSVESWLNNAAIQTLQLSHSTYDTVQLVIEKARSLQKEKFNSPLLSEEDLIALSYLG